MSCVTWPSPSLGLASPHLSMARTLVFAPQRSPGAAFGVPKDRLTPACSSSGCRSKDGWGACSLCALCPGIALCPGGGPGGSEHQEAFGVSEGGSLCCLGDEDQALMRVMLCARPSEFDQRKTGACHGMECWASPGRLGAVGMAACLLQRPSPRALPCRGRGF